ncbi:MAG: tetratricopeptide repeat protein [Gemmatimonadaceae bacterium]|nr:tetratricopeptide repeat protein [Gemmatimonadaceae bacterium]
MMRSLRIACALLPGAVLAPLAACGQEGAGSPALASASALYRTGKYADAIEAAQQRLAADSGDAVAAVTLLRALVDVGRVDEAVQVGARLSARAALAPRVGLPGGYALKARGRLAEAERAFQSAFQGPDSLLARYEVALLAFERGEHAAAEQQFDRFIDIYNAHRATLTGSDLRAVAMACRMLGRNDPQLFKDALRAFDEANARDTLELEGLVQLGEMFLDKFNGQDAQQAIDAVLAVNPNHPRALLAKAELMAFDGRGNGAELVARSLAVNGQSPEARARAAMQLIDVERYADASDEARKGLVVDSTAPAPLIVLAAARYLAGDRAGHQAALERAHGRLVGSADAEVVLADVAARNRLYREATIFARAGVDRDPKSARALALLGINQMRLGQVSEGGATLQRAFALDPYDVWVKNTLDLIDTFKDYTEVKTPRFVLAVETRDAPILELFVGPLAEMAYDSLSARYGYRPATPVRVELFRSHADFSVRTVGLAGLGALGVSFGSVVAMDSPAARKVGEFNWGSTLWHELAHTVTLGATDNRIPRWLSEGLSVHEERRARAGWGSDVSPSLIAAYKGGLLQPVSRLNDGFMRPRFAMEVPLSYSLASYVCEMIEQTHGIAGIRRLLEGYKQGRTSAEAFSAVVGTNAEEFDRRFDTWFRQRFAAEFRAVEGKSAPGGQARRAIDEEGVPWEGPLAETMRSAARAAADDKMDEAITYLTTAKRLFPGWADEGSAYHMLASIQLKRGDTAQAIAELSAISDRNESAFAENLQLARLRRATGDARGALAALERSVFITPFDVSVHDSLAVLAGATQQHQVAIRSRRAIVALQPSDRAGALYQLAVAYAAAGDVASARREVLRALDLAPNYEKAQELLLTLRKPEAP